MSVAGCYTDFHVDFGGTSVWYHVYKGEKLFLLIPPSLETYDMFQTWHMSGEQESTFFAELVSKAQLVKLNAGDTFIMPSGELVEGRWEDEGEREREREGEREREKETIKNCISTIL